MAKNISMLISHGTLNDLMHFDSYCIVTSNSQGTSSRLFVANYQEMSPVS